MELDTDNGSPSMDTVHHHSKYDYDNMVHHHSEYDYDDSVDHYIEHDSYTDDMEDMMAHDKNYYNYMPHQEEESHEHPSISFEDDFERSMLKFPTLEDGPTYYDSSSSSPRHHRQAQHVDRPRHSSSSSRGCHDKGAHAHESSSWHDKERL